MNSIFKGDVTTARGRTLAWLDALLVDHAVFRLVWSNFAAVAPGRLYRCNHPTPARLAALTRRYGLKTLINLRGRTGNGSDALSRDGRPRARPRLRRCAAGKPRRAAARPDPAAATTSSGTCARRRCCTASRAPTGRGWRRGCSCCSRAAPRARRWRQLSLRFGHIRQARTGVLDAFFHHYAREAEGRKPFLDWVREDYDQAALQRDFHANGLASFINDWVLVHE